MENRRLHGVTIPHMTKEAFDKVEAAFRMKPIKDDATLISIGRQEGHREVIEYLRQFVSESYISGDQKDIDIQEQEYKPSQRLFKNMQNRE